MVASLYRIVRSGSLQKPACSFDAPGGESVSHMRRSVGLAWLELPLVATE